MISLSDILNNHQSRIPAKFPNLTDALLLPLRVQQEIEVLTMAQQDSECSDEHLEQEERKLYSELDGVRSLLRSVTDLTQYQRREMQDNLAVESEIDVEIQVDLYTIRVSRRGAVEGEGGSLIVKYR